MAESDPPINMDEFNARLRRQIKPPHIVFDEEQYNRDLNAGLIAADRYINNSPYYPSELKAAHSVINDVLPSDGKKKVVIAITIAHNWPADYIQKCFDVFCTAYAIPKRPIEVINLGPLAIHGNPPLATPTQASANQSVVNALSTYIDANGTFVSSVTPNDRTSFNTIQPFGYTGDDKIGWLGEMILNFWAIAMNPNAHFRIINAADHFLIDLENAVIYASTDSNFANNPHGTTDYVNMSWGDQEPGNDYNPYDDIVFHNPRICYFAAAGNDRWAGYPATSSNVMCAGGALLRYTSATPINIPENPTVELWVGANSIDPVTGLEIPGGKGGGCGYSHGSLPYVRPAHQNRLAGLLAANNRRACPDMCSLASPETGLLILFTNTAGTRVSRKKLGGTSLASPLLCGVFSHLSQQRHNLSLSPLTTRLTNVGSTTLSSGSMNLQEFLYDNFRMNPVNASSMFYDITVGTTTLQSDARLGPTNNNATYSAGTGYDIATGLGFPQLSGISRVMFPLLQTDTGSGVSSGGNTGVNDTIAAITTTTTTISNIPRTKVIFNINMPPN
jgi:hypothetical protein